MEYLYLKVGDAADNLRLSNIPVRRAFGKHLKLVARALHDIEWVDSADCIEGDEVPAIVAALGVGLNEIALRELTEDAKRIHEALGNLLTGKPMKEA